MERLYWPSGAPLATEQESFDEGYQIGLNWTDNYRPGGPFVHSEHHTRLMNEFRKDLAEEAGLTNHPKEKKLFSIAYNIGHSGGFHEIHSHYLELAELL